MQWLISPYLLGGEGWLAMIKPICNMRESPDRELVNPGVIWIYGTIKSGNTKQTSSPQEKKQLIIYGIESNNTYNGPTNKNKKNITQQNIKQYPHKHTHQEWQFPNQHPRLCANLLAKVPQGQNLHGRIPWSNSFGWYSDYIDYVYIYMSYGQNLVHGEGTS